MTKPSEFQFDKWFRDNYPSRLCPTLDEFQEILLEECKEKEKWRKAYFDGYAAGWKDCEKAK